MCVPSFIAINPIVVELQYFNKNHKGQLHGGAREKVRASPKSVTVGSQIQEELLFLK